MKVRVKFFAILRERAGTAEVVKEMADGSTVADLWRELQKDHAKLDVPGIRMLYAVIRITLASIRRSKIKTKWCLFRR